MFRKPHELGEMFFGTLSEQDKRLKELAEDLSRILCYAKGKGHARGWLFYVVGFIEKHGLDPYFDGNSEFPELTETDLIKLKAFCGVLGSTPSLRVLSNYLEDPDKREYFLSHFKMAYGFVKVKLENNT